MTSGLKQLQPECCAWLGTPHSHCGFRAEFVDRIAPSSVDVLELGCGHGTTAASIAASGRNVLGVDRSERVSNAHFTAVDPGSVEWTRYLRCYRPARVTELATGAGLQVVATAGTASVLGGALDTAIDEPCWSYVCVLKRRTRSPDQNALASARVRSRSR